MANMCSYCNHEIEGEEVHREGKYWHFECFQEWLRKKGC
ncbi:MAG TPA: hypothetical protein ENL18_01215 [Thermoplasmatales archaeon]|nr:hypothetical protein [Thermoplasmatales archaeon]